MKSILASLLLASAAAGAAQNPHAAETPREKDARMGWWREARFGMFIHWGLYAEPAGVWRGTASGGLGEWLMHDLKIPVADYARLVPTFNPVQFDADRWAAVAKAAGMRYVVMTAKHHEGFAMFRSADPFSISATPFTRDPIAEMAVACRRAGLKFGVYYSQAQDWHHAGGAAYGGHWDPKQDGDLHAYVRDVAAPQVRELMKLRPAVLWWDTPVEMSKEDVAALTASLPKAIVTNDRLGNGVRGDTETPEQRIPATGFPGRDWETCMTINDTWGFKTGDTEFKSSASLIRNLVDIASKGGNYLLNVGPDARGVIPAPEVSRLGDVGAWLRKNGASVYGTSASPYRRLPFDGRATVKGRSLFLNVFTRPSTGLTLKGLMTRIKDVRVVATGERLAFTQTKEGDVEIASGDSVRSDGVPTAIELRLAGKPVVVEPDTTLVLGVVGRSFGADEADLTGSVQLQDTPPNVGFWTDAGSTVSWKVRAGEAFRGPVSVEYACAAGTGGSTFAIQLDGKDTGVVGTVEETGGWEAYRTVTLSGELVVPPGVHTLRIVVRSKPGFAVMNLRRLRLDAPKAPLVP